MLRCRVTVRAKIKLAKDLAHPGVQEVLARSQNFSGELLVQAEVDGVLTFVTVRSGGADVNLLATAPASAWRKSSSLLNAVMKGYLSVTVVGVSSDG